MLWRLIVIILIAAALFIGLNWNHTSTVSLWFGESGKINDVPICVSFLLVYILGVVSVIPFILKRHFRSIKKRRKNDDYASYRDNSVSDENPSDEE